MGVEGINASGFGYSGVPESGSNASVGTSAGELASDTDCRAVVVQADPDNGADVFLGDTNGQHIQLTAGDSITVAVNNVDYLYVRSASGTQTVNYLLIK